jgi:chromosome segregation protein
LAEALLGDVLVADDLDAALVAWREAVHPVTVVTLAGEAIDPMGAVTGGSEAPMEEALLARARELREIEGDLAAARARSQEATEGLELVRAEVGRVTQTVSAADDALQALRVAEVAASKDRERLEEERTRIAAELEVGALEASGLAGADGEVSGELAAMAARTEEATCRVTDARAQLATPAGGRHGASRSRSASARTPSWPSVRRRRRAIAGGRDGARRGGRRRGRARAAARDGGHPARRREGVTTAARDQQAAEEARSRQWSGARGS